MMRRFLFLLALIFSVKGYSQQGVDCYQFRAGNSSLLLSVKEEGTFSNYQFSPYGNLISSKQVLANLYLYQSQEYIHELALYLYPRRIYSSQDLKFYQPDPKSQYFSPYLFVGADPINYTDKDGQTGKPLFLYQKIEDPDDFTRQGIEDMAGEVSYAYHYPMSDFINGEVGNLPEFNGNVFIHGHMGSEPGRELVVEEASNTSDFKVKGKFSKVSQKTEGIKTNGFDGEEFGRRLRQFSDMNKVPVKNVTLGGCQGKFASQSISKGFLQKEASSAEATAAKPIQFAGLQERKFSQVCGWRNTYKNYDMPMKRPKYYVFEEGESVSVATTRHPDGSEEFMNLLSSDEYGSHYLLPHAEGPELDGMVNGRIPEDLEEDFEFIRTVY